jgi:hypothetical protein
MSMSDSPEMAADYAMPFEAQNDEVNELIPRFSNQQVGAWYARILRPLDLVEWQLANAKKYDDGTYESLSVPVAELYKEIVRQAEALTDEDLRAAGIAGDTQKALRDARIQYLKNMIADSTRNLGRSTPANALRDLSTTSMGITVGIEPLLGFDATIFYEHTYDSFGPRTAVVKSMLEEGVEQGRNNLIKVRGPYRPNQYFAKEYRLHGGPDYTQSGGQITSAISPGINYKGDKLFSRRRSAPDIESLIQGKMARPLEDVTIRDRIRGLIQRVKDMELLGAKQGIIDSFASWESFERARFGGELLDASQSPYKAMLATKNLSSVMAGVLLAGAPVYRDGVVQRVPGRRGIVEIFAPLTEGRYGNILAEWELYAAARRANQLINQTNRDGTSREKLFTQQEIDRALLLANDYQTETGASLFETVFEEWRRFNRQILNFGIQTGAINAELARLWAKNDYVPFYRVMDEAAGDEGPKALGQKRGVANPDTGIRRHQIGRAHV